MSQVSEALDEIAETHAEGLRVVTRMLDEAVSETSRVIESLTGVRKEDLRGSTFSTLVRQHALGPLLRAGTIGGTFEFKERPNVGLRLIGGGRSFRIRSYPRYLATGRPVTPQEPADQYSLFGEPPEIPFEGGVLWTVDPETYCLNGVWVAALDFSIKPTPQLYAARALDVADALENPQMTPTFLDGLQPDEDDFGWERFLNVGEDDDPA